MIVSLLDVNLLLPILWPRHSHHELATRWFRAGAMQSFATCPFTQAAFVRISCTESVMGERVRMRDALALLRGLTSLEGHRFWPATVDLFEAVQPFEPFLYGPKQVTDAYLLGLARHHGGRLATIDRAVTALAGAAHAGLVELLG